MVGRNTNQIVTHQTVTSKNNSQNNTLHNKYCQKKGKKIFVSNIHNNMFPQNSQFHNIRVADTRLCNIISYSESYCIVYRMYILCKII